MLGGLEDDILHTINLVAGWIFNQILSFLTMNPKNWAESVHVWGKITDISNRVLPLACSLVVLFFMIGFCENTINVKEQIKLETLFQLFIRIGITQYFVLHALDIVVILFDFVTALAGLVLPGASPPAMNGIADGIYYTSDMGRVVLLLPILILFVLAPVCLFMILLMLVMRFFRLLVAVPYAALAFSAMASGSRHFTNIVPGYVKYILSILLEAFSISIALAIGCSMISSPEGLLSLSSLMGENHFIDALLGILQYGCSCALLLMLCKTAQNAGTKALSLDR